MADGFFFLYSTSEAVFTLTCKWNCFNFASSVLDYFSLLIILAGTWREDTLL